MNWTIPELLQFSGSYWGACALHAGVKLDVFSALADGAKGSDAVAQRSKLDVRGTAMLLDALAAIGLLVKATDGYALTPFAADYLVRSASGYLGHIIMHHHHLMESWARLPDAVRSGAPVRGSVSHGAEEEVRESFLMGMFNLASQLAPQIAAKLDLQGRRRLLDLGGGPGTYAIHFCLHNPQLTAMVFDLPTTRSFAEGCIDRYGLADRISFAAGDFSLDELPGGFDTAWLSHVLHSDGPEGCVNLLRKGVAALEPGGLLLVQEFILNDDKDGPVFPALFSLNMLVGTAQGRSYSEQELVELMTGAGLREVRRLPAELPNGAGIMIGVKQ